MIVNALIFCVCFLLLFGLSLWPVLLKNSKRFKLVLIVANLIFIAMLLFSAAFMSESEKKQQKKQEAFRKDTLPAIAKKLEASEKREYTKVSESEMDIEKIESAVELFSKEVTEE